MPDTDRCVASHLRAATERHPPGPFGTRTVPHSHALLSGCVGRAPHCDGRAGKICNGTTPDGDVVGKRCTGAAANRHRTLARGVGVAAQHHHPVVGLSCADIRQGADHHAPA
ncbi:hypothetical protein D3C86_1644680 [compost metagenome]